MTPTPQKAEEFKDYWISQQLPQYPQTPGCYLMKDTKGRVFYVGKAKNLRKRLKSYFTGNDPRFFVGFLAQILQRIDFMEVRTEKEALLLEKSLVKEMQPRFNVLLRDDKDFIRLRLKRPQEKGRLRAIYPKLEVVRKTKKDNALYYGPFASASAARLTLRTINKYFDLRTCTDQVLENRSRPCLQYQIGRCPAPCVKNVATYPQHLQEVSLFLDGKLPTLMEQLQQKMWRAAHEENFETAAKTRDQIDAVTTILEEQVVVNESRSENLDVIGTARGGAQLEIIRMAYRKGRLCGQTHYSFSKQEFPTEELVTSVLQQVYEHLGHAHDADLVVSDLDFGEDKWQLETTLNQYRAGKKVQLLQARRGHKRKLVNLANQNAATQLERQLKAQEETTKALDRLQKRLRLKHLPIRIECFDVSLFQGDAPVVSQIVFVNGQPQKSLYRQYNIKTVSGTDDYAMLAEAVSRRLTKGLAENDLPQILLLDGGKGQLQAIMTVCSQLGLNPTTTNNFLVAAVAKARHLGDSGRGYAGKQSTHQEQKSPERLFVPHLKDPIILRAHTSELFLIERIRDEAHRFAITAHRKKRHKKALGSALEHIPGVGPKKRRALLRQLGSVSLVQNATLEQLMSAPGIGRELAKTIFNYFRNDN